MHIPDDPTPVAANRIAVISLGGIGDAVLFSPVLKALHTRYPYANIVIIAANSVVSDAYENAPGISKVLTAKLNSGAWGRFWAWIHVAFRLRKPDRFDLAVYATGLHPFYFAALNFISRVRCSIQAPSPVSNETDLNCNVNLARLFLPSITEADVFIMHDAATHAESRRILAQTISGTAERPLVALYPSIDLPRRPQWPLNKMAQVAVRLMNKMPELHFVVLGLENEGTEWLRVNGGMDKVSVLAGKLSIQATASLLSECRLMLGNDGGLIHVAGAVKCPVIAMMPNTPLRYRPPGIKSHVIAPEIDCGPCHNRPKSCKIPSCVDLIEVDDVYKKCISILESY